MGPGGDEGAKSRMDPQTGLPLGAPEAGSLWRSANVETDIRQHDASKVGRLPECSQPGSSASAPVQQAARKTVSAKSTPNDDASEASTNEAAISEIATPSPNEDYQQGVSNVYPAYKSPGLLGSPSWRSPAIQPTGGVKSPADDLSLSASGARAAYGGKGGGAAHSAGLPALVSSEPESALNSMSDPQLHAAARGRSSDDHSSSTSQEPGLSSGASEADNVAVRLHRNLDLEPASAEAGAAPAGQAVRSAGGRPARSSDYMRWLISSISRQLPTAGRAQLSAALREYQRSDASTASPSPHELPADLAAAPEPRLRPATSQESIDELVEKIKGICQQYGVSMPTPEEASCAAGPVDTSATAVSSSFMSVDAKGGHGGSQSRLPARQGKGGSSSAAGKAAAEGGAGAGAAPERRAAKRDDGDESAGDARALGAQGETKRRRSAAPGAARPEMQASASSRGRSAEVAAPGGGEASAPQVHKLKETALCAHLTNAVATLGADADAPSQSPVIVRVVGEAPTSSGGYLHRSKCIMAFQVASSRLT